MLVFNIIDFLLNNMYAKMFFHAGISTAIFSEYAMKSRH